MTSSVRNVFVGVSLKKRGAGSGAYAEIAEIARAELNYNRLVFLIADNIDLINQRVFRRGDERNLLDNIERKSVEIERVICAACDEGEIRSGKIGFCRWVDILNGEYWRCFFEIHKLFLKNLEFQNDIFRAAQEYADTRTRELTSAECLYLCSYVMHELPTLLYGVRIRRKEYKFLIYPAPVRSSIGLILERLKTGSYQDDLFRPPFCHVTRYDIDSG